MKIKMEKQTSVNRKGIRQSITNLQKKQIIELVENWKATYAQIMTQFNLKQKSNITEIMRNKEKYLEACNNGHILIFVDNCNGHPTNLSFNNIKILI